MPFSRTPMRRRRYPVAVMAVWCAFLAATVYPVADRVYGAPWISVALFTVSAALCALVFCFPGNLVLRPASGAFVAFSFAWRAVGVTIAWLQGDQRYLIFGPILYLGLTAFFSICWAELLPALPRTRETVERLSEAR